MASTSAIAYQAGDILVKGGAATVAPNEDSSDVTPLAGSQGAKVNNDTQLGLTLTYMYTDHVGIELLAATPFEHDVKGTGAVIGGVDVASIKHLPPTLTLNYYPASADSKFQPYIGAGINYTIFFDEDADSAFEAVAGKTDVELDDSWGLAFHAGIDYQINDRWSLNAAYWYLDIDTEATLKTANVGKQKVDVDVDPDVYMIGLSYKF
jgi:outer membrane protein